MQSLNIVLQVHIQQIILHHSKYQTMYAYFEHSPSHILSFPSISDECYSLEMLPM